MALRDADEHPAAADEQPVAADEQRVAADEHRDGAHLHQGPEEPQHPLPLDLRLARHAERQWGVVDVDELRLVLGFTRGALAVRRDQRRLTRLHRGVHRVGAAPLRFEGHVLAAVKAVALGGAVAAAADRSAAALHALSHPGAWDPVHVLVQARGRRSRPTITVHSQERIPAADLTVVRGVPSTTWARTVLDLGEGRAPRTIERALDQAVVAECYDEQELLEVLARNPGRIGGAVLLEVLGRHQAGSSLTDSGLEELFLTLCRDEALPAPVCQFQVDDWRCDAAWPQYGVVVELDGSRYHAGAERRRRDRRKDTALRRRGLVVLRFDGHDLTVGSRETGNEVRTTLRARGWTGG